MLLDFVQTQLDAVQIGDLLTMAGFELEGIEEVNGDSVLDIKVCSNRGDGLSVLGLAREILAKEPNSKPTALYQNACEGFLLGDEATELAGARVKIESPDCSRFSVRRFKGSFASLKTPDWIQTRLTQAGMRPISLLVDLSNYVMLEIGQPNHAYDEDTLRGRTLVARKARPGEKITTLDGVERNLEPQHLVISDAERAVGVAGVMGGLDTEVTEGTTTVILEAANFLNTSVRKTRRNLGLNTEASYRFERSVDPNLVVAALNRFAMLLEQVDGGSSRIPGIKSVIQSERESIVLNLNVERANLLLGMQVTGEEIDKYLSALGYELQKAENGFSVKVPSWRFDVTREEDLIEDIGRVHGYEKIPEKLPQGATLVGGPKGFEKFVDRIRDAALGCGLDQIISHSLKGSHPLDAALPTVVGPRNPVPEMEYLRNSLLPCLAWAANRNGNKDLHLFELGKVFGSDKNGYVEFYELGILTTGAIEGFHYSTKELIQADFFSLKGIVEEILGAFGAAATYKPSQDPRLHPTRQATVLVQGKEVGVFGQVHPEIADQANLSQATYLAALHPQALFAAIEALEPMNVRSISRNPSVRRDISMLFNESVTWTEVEAAVHASIDTLEKVWLFDEYRGQGVPEGHRSLSLAIQLRKLGSNFTDEEANKEREKVVAALQSLGGTAR